MPETRPFSLIKSALPPLASDFFKCFFCAVSGRRQKFELSENDVINKDITPDAEHAHLLIEKHLSLRLCAFQQLLPKAEPAQTSVSTF